VVDGSKAVRGCREGGRERTLLLGEGAHFAVGDTSLDDAVIEELKSLVLTHTSCLSPPAPYRPPAPCPSANQRRASHTCHTRHPASPPPPPRPPPPHTHKRVNNGGALSQGSIDSRAMPLWRALQHSLEHTRNVLQQLTCHEESACHDPTGPPSSASKSARCHPPKTASFWALHGPAPMARAR
jgi:hypothetical protein